MLKFAITGPCAAIMFATVASAQNAPIAWWQFNETSGSTAADSGSLGADGTLSGNASFTAGVSGNAISLPGGATDFVSMGNVLPLLATDFSMQTWVRTSSSSSLSSIIAGKHRTNTNNGYMMRVNLDTGGYGVADRASFYQSGTPGTTAVSTTAITDDQWHHLLATYTVGGQLKLYVDGNLETTISALNIADNTASFMVGGATQFGVERAFFTGLVDEVQVYDYALNADQVTFLANNPGLAIPAPSAGAAMLVLAAMTSRRRR
jgi:hypothetical protein